ncbi:MAG TPA: hypothetical protein VFZ57_07910, partial [Thermoanaerobaculia bacterium]|nr:hypothetical protein [Thermoanaerobaculia bacterium]
MFKVREDRVSRLERGVSVLYSPPIHVSFVVGVRRVRMGADRRQTIGNDGSKGVLMFKRVLFVFVSVALALGFSACGGNKEDDAEEETASKATTTTAASAPAAAAAPAAAGSATVTGKVTFTGAAPAKEQIKMDADAFCKGAHAAPVYTEDVIANPNGTLQWVLVYVKEGVTGTYPPPATPVTL